MNVKQVLVLGLGSALLLSPALLEARRAQEQDQESVADAARKAQAAKKTEPKAKMVIDDDNLGTITGSISVVGQQPVPPADQTKAVVSPDEKKTPVQDETYWRNKFADANKKLADDEHELDVDQRDYNLKEQQYYSDPNQAMKEQNDRQDLNDSKAKIDELTAAVAQDKQDIADLEDALHKAGGDPGWESAAPATPATPPQ